MEFPFFWNLAGQMSCSGLTRLTADVAVQTVNKQWKQSVVDPGSLETRNRAYEMSAERVH